MKNKIIEKTKTLTATWKVDLVKDLHAHHGVSVTEELSNILAEEIDNEIVMDMLIKSSTIPFKQLEMPKRPENKLEILEWVRASTPTAHFIGSTYLYHNEEDAILFRLKWL